MWSNRSPSLLRPRRYQCRGHPGELEHITVDELSCFPHNINAGLLEYSKDSTRNPAHNMEPLFFLESTKPNSLEKRPSAKGVLLWSSGAILFCSTETLHLIPVFTGFNFPPRAEYFLLRVSCYAILIPLVVFVVYMLWQLIVGDFSGSTPFTESLKMNRDHNRDPVTGRSRPTSKFTTVLPSVHIVSLIAGYFCLVAWARVILLVRSFIALRKGKWGIFLTPDWNWLDYVPHS